MPNDQPGKVDPKWEVLDEGGTVSRFPVPGGWLYRVALPDSSGVVVFAPAPVEYGLKPVSGASVEQLRMDAASLEEALAHDAADRTKRRP